MKVFLGIDWGGTYLKAGLVDYDGKIVKKIIYASGELKKKTVFIEELARLVKEWQSFDIQGVGIGAPGIVDIKKGFIYYLPNIKGWERCPLAELLEKKLRLPVFIDNDANVFALAEARYGAAKGKQRGIFLTLGTGLGSSIIFDEKLLRPGTISALELGHVPVSLENRNCSCGGKGCIETFTGSKYLIKRYIQLKKGKVRINEVEEIFKKALKKEKEALMVWKEFSYALGTFLCGMINIFNPEVIVFGGGVAAAFPLFRPLIQRVIKKQAMWPQVKGVTLRRAKLKDSGIIGAALLVKDAIEEQG